VVPLADIRLGADPFVESRSTLATMVEEDPVTTNPAHYRTIFENEFVRVLDYSDVPGDSTTPHAHPNSVMITPTDFQRRLTTDAGQREAWAPASAGEILLNTLFMWALTRTPLRELLDRPDGRNLSQLSSAGSPTT